MTVEYEASMMPNAGNPGITDYDVGGLGIALQTDGPLLAHGTDDAPVSVADVSASVVKWANLDLEIGGAPGQVDRNAYVLGGMAKPDAHDFRGDRVKIPPRGNSGTYGDAGNSADAATAYSQGIAAQSYPNITNEESQDYISQGY